MGVLPAASKHALPPPLRHLFDCDNSSILDFYPKDFQVDMNGKRFAWQGVALLPFIDEQRLLDATGPIIASLPPEDKRRNERCVCLSHFHRQEHCSQFAITFKGVLMTVRTCADSSPVARDHGPKEQNFMNLIFYQFGC
jgi:5'-3' exonuclease